MKNTLSWLGGSFALAMPLMLTAAPINKTIFVSAKAPIAAEEFSGAVSIVTAQDIKLSGATTVAEALASLPGISVTAGTGNAKQEIRIRGMQGEYGLILVDGKRVPNAERNISSSPANRTTWASLESIERIEVIRGAASSLYGADALSGIINIITKKAGEEWRNSITLTKRNIRGEGGAGSGIHLATSGKISNNIDLSLNINSQIDEEIRNDDNSSQQSERETTQSQLKLGFNISEHERLELGAIYGKEFADSAGDELNQKKRLTSLDYTGKVGEFHSALSLSVARDNIDDNGTDWSIEDNNVGVDLDGELTENQYFSGGISYREESAKRPNLDFDDAFKSWSLYGQDVIDLSRSSALTLGISAEEHNKYGSAFSPKVYWNKELNDNWGIKLGYSEGRIAPAIREGSSNYVINAGPTRTYRGNDDLQPEESSTSEFSMSYRTDELSSTFTVFDSDVENLIDTQDINSSPSVFDNLYSNVKRSSIQGLESDLNWQVNSSTALKLNYTYIDAVNRDNDSADNGNQISKQPKHTANLTYIQYLDTLDASVSIALKTVSEQYTNAANTEEIEGYETVDLGLVKTINNLELQANIININDREVLDEDKKAIHAGRELRFTLTGHF